MSTVKVDTLVASDGTSPVTLTKQHAGKAWVKGSNAAALSGSFNFSSGTDNGTGQYTYNYTNNMNDSLYAIAVTCHSAGISEVSETNQTTSAYKVQCFNRTSLGSFTDVANYGTIHGDLA